MESAPASPSRAARPSRRVGMALTLFFGPGVGHTYLGVALRGLYWALLPLLAGLVLCASVIRAGRGYGFILPGVLLIVLLRLGALIDVFVVPEGRLRRTSLLWVVLFWAASVIGSVALALLIRTYLVQAFKIPGGGMQPTLLVQDHVFVAMGAFRRESPKRGDLAVFVHPEHPDQDYVKRVIAVPGDRLEVRDGHPFLNGWPVPHCTVGNNVTLPRSQVDDFVVESRGALELEYLGEHSYLVFIDDNRFMAAEQTWTVAPNELFVLGDNRNNSADSRTWFEGHGGGVPFENLIGRPVVVWLAFRADGSVDWPRLNARLDEPHLPPTLLALEPALRACLRSKPAQTAPP